MALPHLLALLVAAALLTPATVVAASSKLPTNARVERVVAQQSPKLSAELEARGLRLGAAIFVRVFKESAELELWVQDDEQFALFKTYEICSFSGQLGPKLAQGDRQSPEGFYYVGAGQMNPWSRFHLSFNLGFPNAYDRRHGRTGSYLMVHGDCVSIGCYAMTDDGIEEIYTLAAAAIGAGQRFFRVHVFPFRMTDARMATARAAASRWYSFWANLKEGYDWFEHRQRPPEVIVDDKKYAFRPS